MNDAQLTISCAPHINRRDTVQLVMLDVVFALLPAVFISVLFFRFYAVKVILLTTLFCFGLEYLYVTYVKKRKFVNDYSAIVTGLLLAMNLPPSAPVWLMLIGSLLAVILAKQVFGGLGQNPFNPALVARVILLISWPTHMTTWIQPAVISFKGFFMEAVTAATPLGVLAEHGPSALAAATRYDLYKDLFFGNVNGCLGETSVFALLIGGVYLLVKRRISWHIPVMYIGATAVLSGVFWQVDPARYMDPLFHILSGGLMIGALFMATDMVTSPITHKGMLIFGAGCGILTVLIRLFGAYPEGVSFSIITMNALVPLIDRFTRPRRYGEKTAVRQQESGGENK